MNKLTLAFTAARELGLRKLLYLALYKLGLKSGHYRRVTATPKRPARVPLASKPLFSPPELETLTFDRDQTLTEANLITQGQVRLFGADAQPLNLTPDPPLFHWTAYETGQVTWGEGDIKSIWEPARFLWAFTLARAYALTPDEAYPETFWQAFESFQQTNPSYRGPNWLSAQEAALRILAFVFCNQIFSDSEASTAKRCLALAQSIAEHAIRIPPTLLYARAQNNNHLLSEAVGLYTASIYLPTHPCAKKWHKLGWNWFNWAIQHQVSPQGTYGQHATNYHRLMLQLALWVDSLTRLPGVDSLPELTRSRLAAATKWLWALTDPLSGRTPNLGANDGAHILPLSSLNYDDFRPTLQAAGRAFLDQSLLAPGPWDELSAWLGLPLTQQIVAHKQPQAADMPRIDTPTGHAFLRVAQFTDRPSHADQLHIDIWHKGETIAFDAGSYSYNAPPPWQNALQSSLVHNTVTINDRDQMTLVNRFLWLNWAQAEVLETQHDETSQLIAITAQHDGYAHLGWLHRRSLTALEDGGWCIDDLLVPIGKVQTAITARLSWLLPDHPWQITANILTIHTPKTVIRLTIKGADTIALVRAGETLYGDLQPQPTWGWHSSTYSLKQHALQLIAETHGQEKPFFSSTFWFLDINTP